MTTGPQPLPPLRFFQSRVGALVIAAAITAAIGTINVLGGHRIGLSVFYLVPVFVVTWIMGRVWGFGAALVSALVNSLTDPAPEVPAWDFAAQLTMYAVSVYVLSELRRALDRERELARTDTLTGLANRRSFFERAVLEIERSLRYGRPFSVAVLDVDDFKQVNDRFGHAVGDAVLQAVASAIHLNTRSTDLVARLGGDEFAVLLPETDADAAQTMLNKLHGLLLQAMQAQRWPVTASIGLVTFDAPPASVDELVRRADTVMYEVKRAGKNQIRHEVVTW